MRNAPRTRRARTGKDETPKIMSTRDLRPTVPDHAQSCTGPGSGRCLDPIQLNRLEQAFRKWADSPRRPDLGSSRKRVLLIFLLIRYTGARLNEVLDLDLRRTSIPIRTRSCLEKGLVRATGPTAKCRYRKGWRPR